MPERLLDNPKHWRDREEEKRSLAELMDNPETKRRLLKIADEYRHLAELAEQRVEERLGARSGDTRFQSGTWRESNSNQR